MAGTSKATPLPKRDVFYHRRRQKNRVYSELLKFFEEEAKKNGVTKKLIADLLECDPALITRWLSGPSNLTLDTISDLLLTLGAEMDPQIVRFKERPSANAFHPFLETDHEITPEILPPPLPVDPRLITNKTGTSQTVFAEIVDK